MKIVLTGGGSGGHITPLLAVAHEIKQLQPQATLIYIGQYGDSLGDVAAHHPDIDAAYTVHAGKFRRYHGEGFMKQVMDVPTLVMNARDMGRVMRGLTESYRLLRRLKPDIVFIKGGFVGVPVGLAAAKLHIPFVTHDSDAIPGLANRIIARWATLHAVALPKNIYPYPPAKTVTVGVPVQATYEPVNEGLQKEYRSQLHIPRNAKVLLVTGGGLGAQRLNKAIVQVAPALLKRYSDLVVLHATGRQHELEMQQLYQKVLGPKDQIRVRTVGFVSDFYLYSGAADIIVTRAGATNLAEFAVQGKACIVVPHPNLTGGHQLKNAESLAKSAAAIVVPETELTPPADRLTAACIQLLENDTQRQKLAENLFRLAHPKAAHELATLLLEGKAAVNRVK